MKRLILAAVLGAAVLATTAATPQDEWEKQVRAQLTAVGEHFATQGYTLTHRVWTGALADGATTTVQIPLQGGREYQIMGVCDTDCSDLDLRLYNPAGTEIDSDLLEDDAPIVSVESARAGTYTVRVLMAACSEEPCRYGIGVYGK